MRHREIEIHNQLRSLCEAQDTIEFDMSITSLSSVNTGVLIIGETRIAMDDLNLLRMILNRYIKFTISKKFESIGLKILMKLNFPELFIPLRKVRISRTSSSTEQLYENGILHCSFWWSLSYCFWIDYVRE